MAEQESSVSKLSRKRARNFEEKETTLLLELFDENRDLLRSKHNNLITQNKKKAVLQEITDKVNSLGVCHPLWCHRTVQQIKNKWTNIVVDGKEKDTQIKKSLSKTGGGPPCSPPSAVQEKIISMFSETPGFSGLEGNLESDLFSEDEENHSEDDPNWIQMEIPDSLENWIQPIPDTKEDTLQSTGRDDKNTPACSKMTLPCNKTSQTATKPTRKRPMSVQELQKDVLVLQRNNMQMQRSNLKLQNDNLMLENEFLRLKIRTLKSKINES